MNDNYNTKLEMDAGMLGKVSLEVDSCANIKEWVETFERLLLFLGYDPASIKDCFKDAGEQK